MLHDILVVCGILGLCVVVAIVILLANTDFSK